MGRNINSSCWKDTVLPTPVNNLPKSDFCVSKSRKLTDSFETKNFFRCKYYSLEFFPKEKQISFTSMKFIDQQIYQCFSCEGILAFLVFWGLIFGKELRVFVSLSASRDSQIQVKTLAGPVRKKNFEHNESAFWYKLQLQPMPHTTLASISFVQPKIVQEFVWCEPTTNVEW